MIHRPDKDGLRTTAMLPVIIFHVGLCLSRGVVGVDVFFVTSGYLITMLPSLEMDTRQSSLLDDVPRGDALHIPSQLRTQRFGLPRLGCPMRSVTLNGRCTNQFCSDLMR